LSEPAVDRQYCQQTYISHHTLAYLDVVSPTLRREAHKKLVSDAVNLLRRCKNRIISGNAWYRSILNPFSSPFLSGKLETKIIYKTNLLSRVLDKIIVAQLVKKFPVFY
jgi:hypothetical protein